MLPIAIKAFFNNEQVSSFFKNQPEEKRLTVIKDLGNLLVFGTISNAVMILAALTSDTRYFLGILVIQKRLKRVCVNSRVNLIKHQLAL